MLPQLPYLRRWLLPTALVATSVGPTACSLTAPGESDFFSGQTSVGGGGTGGGGTGGTGGAGGAAGGVPTGDPEFCAYQLDLAALEYDQFRKSYTNPTEIPRSHDGTTITVSPNDWSSGFVAGSFWLMYEHTGEENWRATAEVWTQALISQATRTSDHDIGFIINTSYGNGYRLTQSSSYESVLRQAAESAIQRYDPVVGAIKSWDFAQYTYPVIVDSLMNLELLFRGSELSEDPQYAQIGVTHALTVAANHYRPDASAHHVVDFDQTGNVLSKTSGQAIDNDSAWARGQAWGLYGYTMLYRESDDARFLTQAQLIADFYVDHPMMPEDGVPYWDLDAPEHPSVTDYRDTSAGAIATSALFELANHVSGARREKYLAFAIKAVRSLSGPAYRAVPRSNGNFLLQHAVGHYPEMREVDVALNFADYYYLEALMRCKALEDD